MICEFIWNLIFQCPSIKFYWCTVTALHCWIVFCSFCAVMLKLGRDNRSWSTGYFLTFTEEVCWPLVWPTTVILQLATVITWHVSKYLQSVPTPGMHLEGQALISHCSLWLTEQSLGKPWHMTPTTVCKSTLYRQNVHDHLPFCPPLCSRVCWVLFQWLGFYQEVTGRSKQPVQRNPLY